MDPSNNFPKARSGLGPMNGGFGFNGPSEAWLKANGLSKTSITSSSGTLDASELSIEEKEDRRRKALERFGKPYEEIKLVPEPEAPVKKLTPQEILQRENLAKAREEALVRNQMELDLTVIPSEEPRKIPKFSSEKRDKCLSWINFVPAVNESIFVSVNVNLQHLIDSEGCDFFIETCDGLRIGGHRLILSARSCFFRTLISGNTSEAMSGVLQIPDFSGQVVRLMINFLYSGTVKPSTEEIIELLYLSEYLKIDNLKLIIQNQLSEFISTDNLITFWELSEDLHLDSLKKACLKFSLKTPDVKKLVNEMPKEIKSQYFKLLKDKAI